MIPHIVTRDFTKDDWWVAREKIKARIFETFGKPPVPLSPEKGEFCELERYTEYGLVHIKIKYRVFEDEWSYAIIILPNDIEKQGKARAVLTSHGTNGTVGKYGVCDEAGTPRRAYATELARRGFVTISPDQYGFGEAMECEEEKRRFEAFYDRYPNWSLSSRRVLGHIRALDVLDALDYVRHDGYGVIGNSLGGQASFYLAALDERIKAAVISTPAPLIS